MRQEIKIAGFGGQGVAFAGFVLGKAFALYEGYEAVVTQAYGPEARGGASHTSLIISDETIDYPFVQQPDILVALSQEAFHRFYPTLKPNGRLLIDEELVTPDGDIPSLAKIPSTRMAEELGRRIVANMVMLGYFTAVIGMPSLESLLKAVETSVKPGLVELNVSAVQSGYQYGNEGGQS